MKGAMRRHALALCDERLVVLACRCYGCAGVAGAAGNTMVVLVAQDIGTVLEVRKGG